MITKIIFRFALIIITLTIYVPAHTQGTWVWVSGSSIINASPSPGTQGIPSVNNHPAALYECGNWIDGTGNLWLYGGRSAPGPVYSDMWKFDAYTLEWTWVKGPGTTGQNPVYGTQNVASPANTPGERLCPITWVDNNGVFWLYGGSVAGGQRHADLWKYEIATNNWTWVDGSQLTNVIAFNGTKGVPANINTPGSRLETAVSWVDANNNLWFYGGLINNSTNFFNDIWRYNIATGQWAWMDGNNFFQPNAAPVFGVQGIASNTNDPGARNAFAHWSDINGNEWIYGGSTGPTGPAYSDVWKYNPATLQWTWMQGSTVANNTGNNAVACYFDAANLPAARTENKATYKDVRGNVWMFGGANAATTGNFNDLWIFRMDSLQWKWLGGSNMMNLNSNYGSLGVPDTANVIPSRDGAIMFGDTSCHVFVFGGTTRAIFSSCYADVWMFIPDSTCVPCNPLPQSVASFTMSDTIICKGGQVSFTDNSTGGIVNWQWTFTGGTPATSTNQVPPAIVYSSNGTFPVTLTVNNGINTSTYSSFITVNNLPSVSLGNDTSICDTASYTLTVNNTFASYLWSNGSTISSISVNTTGQYWVTVSDGMCTASDSVNVSVVPCNKPVASIMSATTLLCEKGSIDFVDNSTGNPTSWLWYFSGASPSTSTMQNPAGIYYASYGTYSVALVATNAAGSDSVYYSNYITVVANPAPPVISYVGNLLCCTMAAGYQWYYNSNPMPNDTSVCIAPLQAGNYFVIISDSNGCNAASNSVTVTAVSHYSLSHGLVSSYNASSHQWNIKSKSFLPGPLFMEIIDCTAKIIFTKKMDGLLQNESIILDASIFDAGIYFIKVSTPSGISILKAFKF